MVMKSVIDIDVNDEQFKAFHELFADYQAKLESMPEDWAAIDAATKKAAKSFSSMTGTADILAEIALHTRSMSADMKKAIQAQKEFNSAARQSEKTMKSMASEAVALSKSVFGIGKFLFKMGAIGIGGSALGAFGLDALGRNAVNGQRDARGLGLNQGQIKAWQTDMGRYVDSGMLNRIASAQTTQQGLYSLSLASGLPMNQIANMSPDELAMKISQQERSYWKSTPAGMQTMMPQWTHGFSQFSNAEEARRLSNAADSELPNAYANYRRDSGAFNVSDRDVAAWYQFTRQLSVAGSTLETVLTHRLSELAPYLATFVNTMTEDAKAFIESAITPENIKKFGEGVKDIATYLGSDEFKTKVKNLGVAVDDLASGIIWLADKLSFLKPKEDDKLKPAGPAVNALRTLDPLHLNPLLWQKKDGATNPAISGKVPAGTANYLRSLDAQAGLPAGTMDAIWATESGRGKNAGRSSAGALGPFQLMPGNSKGIDPTSFMDSSQRAKELMSSNLNQYGGDIKKALAAYNWGNGNLNKDIASHGDQWMSYAPRETQNYINKILTMLAQRTANGTEVRIYNSTASNVAVQAYASAP